ncbi:MAG TPA: hypothetical protein VLD85_06650 [Anaeromyxobacteraceae bacterium]|nr:hypothetical protein [Anaeromyxobacteraceae bacterium]
MRTFLVAVALLAASPAAAADPSPDRGAALVGAKVGGVVPFSRLGVNAAGAVEAGWLLPWMDRSFAAVLEVSYCQPTAAGSAGDPRVGGAAYDWKLTQRELVIAPTGLFRLGGFGTLTGLAWAGRLVPYAGIGPRIYLLESRVSGSAGGQAMATTTEKATRMGVGMPLGAEYALGPGSLTGELLLEWGALDTRAAGSSTTTAGLTLRFGYRMIF